MNSYVQKMRSYWQRLPIESRGSMAIAIPLVCLLGSVVADGLLQQKTIEAQTYVDHTNQVLIKSQGSLISLLNAETGVRGYYIGKQKVFLEPYNEALATLEPMLMRLEELTQDNPSQIQRVKQVRQLAQTRMKLLLGTIQRVETNVTSEPEVVAQRLRAGKQAMDEFRTVIEQIEAEEYRLLAIRTQSLQEQQALNAHAIWYEISIGIIGTAITIHLLRQLARELSVREVRLRASRNLTETIVENIVDGVIVVNPQGQIETFNEAAVNMFGYALVEVVDWPWQKLMTVSPDRLGGTFEAEVPMIAVAPSHCGSISAAQDISKIWQAMGQRKNGDWFPIEASINRIGLDDERIIIIRDITERQQAAAKLAAKAVELVELNASLNVSNDSLRQSNRELDQFAYITSHDLKAPLRAIASLSEWIEEDLGDAIGAESRSHMHLLRRRVYRMQALLDSLLEYSRVGRKQTPITLVNVAHLLTDVIQTLAPPDTFTINILAPMPTMHTRRQPLQQVFTHFIDNAIRHHPTKLGIIDISVIDKGDRYEFAIADNGDGIDVQFQEKIYTMFQTLKPRDLNENIGAGLATIQKIVTAEGGSVRLESSAGGGAIFRFTWLKQALIKNHLIALDL
jgi:signal transduction histidine kinase/CHASE3 domain sensor protein